MRSHIYVVNVPYLPGKFKWTLADQGRAVFGAFLCSHGDPFRIMTSRPGNIVYFLDILA
jgi:hypothetical protein